ncbi:MAG: tRNA uridine-5-carboxymethylaminomethyl(34) synthesis GTPase MnmE [Bacteroidaceae bacterium]|nr:tRNA uridine-5-carboxymethylaminomethyl(34) synthesis GTPase MnmE [Bacteroidaceae bacterium]
MLDSGTICAPATAPGGALAIIRVSGPKALSAVGSLCKGITADTPANTVHFVRLTDGEGSVLDEVLVSVFHAPHSYTGEDAVEISCHGSRYIINKVLEELVRKGCRMARPGEFTERAFLNGKMDLAQAEAVADLIASTNRATHQLAMSQLRGHFSSELTVMREQLLKLTTLLELELDFSDHEDLEFAERSELLALALSTDAHITRLAQTFEAGQALKKGIPVAIVGKTNVGKSTLLNRLLRDDRAIVSDIHGTTRDTIEDVIDLQGISFRFIDTAGIRQTNDKVEQIGINRTYAAIDKAHIILWLIDETPTQAEMSEMQARCADKKLLIVQNKIDLTHIPQAREELLPSSPIIRISAKRGTNLNLLENAIVSAADILTFSAGDVIVTNARHYEALIRAKANLQRVISGLQNQLSGDLIAEDLRIVLSDLSEITGGLITSQETLNNVFSHFCVGK